MDNIRPTFIALLIFSCSHLIASGETAYQEALRIYKQEPAKAINLLKKDLVSETDSTRANASYFTGYIHYTGDRFEEALTAYYRSLIIYEALEIPGKIINTEMAIGAVLYTARHYTSALNHYQAALAASRTDELKARNNYNVGLCLKRMNRHEQAITSFIQSFQYYLDVKDKKNVCKLLNEIGLVYYYAGDFTAARKKYFELLETAQLHGQDEYVGIALNNIGNSYLEENNHSEAISFLKEAISMKRGDRMLSSFLNLGRSYTTINRDSSHHYLVLAKQEYRNEKDLSEYTATLNQLRLLHEVSNPDSSFYYASILSEQAVEMTSQNEELLAYAESLKLQAHERRLENQRQRAHEREKENFRIWAVIVGFLLIAFLLWKLIQPSKHKTPEALQKKMDMMDMKMNLVLKQNEEYRKVLDQMNSPVLKP